MPLLPDSPHIKILLAVVRDAEAIDDWEETTGVAVDTVRHARNRFPTKSEGNTISVRWVGSTDSDIQEIYKSADERVRSCDLEIDIDLRIPAEESGADPTGWAGHSRVYDRLLMQLRDEDSDTYRLSAWAVDGNDEPDEDSKPDEGRLVKRLSVIYRVRTDAPNVLLAEGENG